LVHEDASLIVLDKPPGVVIHPAPGHPKGTLVHGLLQHCDDLSGIGGVLRPGIVH
ncbi:MAG: RluA family pseudouridine synthase, partial [Desulfobacterales bacterium]|nr:RluA family pseudouridine synthase [Desulfobacterales bacterium]